MNLLLNKTIWIKRIFFIVILLLTVSCSNNDKNDINESEEAVFLLPENENITLSDNRFKTVLPKKDDVIDDFKVMHVGKIDKFNANTAHFFNEKSGLNLYYIQNDDRELSFQISFKVPYEDETDAPMAMKNTILYGSEKYNSDNLFNELMHNTFNTGLNAYTETGVTSYSASSMSEEQLIKLFDVYMSCIKSPMVLKDENIFKKEVIRYTLSDKKEDIEIEGSLYDESVKNITSVERNILSNIKKVLYGGTILENDIGKSYENFNQLTYDKIKDIYNKYYNMDNAIIVLYGNLDYNNFLKLLNDNYLNDNKKTNVDFDKLYNIENGDIDISTTSYIKIYEDDETANNVVTWVFELPDLDIKTKYKIRFLNSIFNADNSILDDITREMNLDNKIHVYDTFTSGEMFDAVIFEMENCNEDDVDVFETCINDALDMIKSFGFDENVIQNEVMKQKFKDIVADNSRGIGANLSKNIAANWIKDGSLYFLEYETLAYDEFLEQIEEFSINYVDILLNSKKKALIYNEVKRESLEEIEKIKKAYLKELKKNMNDDLINRLIEDTKSFNDKSSNIDNSSRNNYSVDIKNLPSPNIYKDVAMANLNEIRSYSSYVNFKDIGKYMLLFDTSNIEQKELFDMNLWSILVGKLPTEYKDKYEISDLMNRFFYSFDIKFMYPDEKSIEFNYPMIIFEWECFVDDYKDSLNILLEMFDKTVYNENDVIEIIEKCKEDYNMVNLSPSELVKRITFADTDTSFAYETYLTGREFYKYLNEQLERLKNENNYIDSFSNKMKNVKNKIINKNNLSTYVVADLNGVNTVEDVNKEILLELESIELKEAKYKIPYGSNEKSAIYVDDKNQNMYFTSEYLNDENFKYEYLPFIKLLEKVMFSNNISEDANYNGSIDFDIDRDILVGFAESENDMSLVTKDLNNIVKAAKDYEVTDEEFYESVIKAYSHVCYPIGEIENAYKSFMYNIIGKDVNVLNSNYIKIKNSNIELKDEALDSLKNIIDDKKFTISGTEKKITKIKINFDKIYDFTK